MVGVCFLLSIILMVSSAKTTKFKECPDICNCLGAYVDCTSKHLERIPNTIPKWVMYLDLNNNAIKNLSNVEWDNWPQLTELRLGKNNIPSIPAKCFYNQTNLKLLELNRNNLKSIDALRFSNLKHLTTLKLKKNHISQLKDGAFYGLSEISKLILDHNKITVISKKWLYGLDSLKELTLSYNHISVIENDAWEFCRKLTTLDLSNNRLESIEADTFKNLGDLQKLIINNNNITIIKENAFIHLPRLKVLYLSNNKIWWTIEDANGVFKGLNDLVKFHLAGNNIKSLNKDAFLGLKNVTYLNLDHNNITSIQKNAFLEVPFLKYLIINTTSLICDCNIGWLTEYMSASNLTANNSTIHAICAYPERLHGQSLFKVESAKLICDELPKPRIIEEPDPEIMALKGENISLNCKAISSSNSIMKFQWKKDNVEITNAEVLENSTTIDNKIISTSQLNLRWINHSNAGKYQCVVSNVFGTTYSNKSIISVLVYPTFAKRPQNITVKAGETARLECAANGEPPPELVWNKDGGNAFPAATERRMKYMQEYMQRDYVFFILDTKESDMGVYSCTATNAAGTIVANASLIIQEKPSFVKPMENKEVTAGNIIALPCMANGRPKPTITWLKDGAAITATERHFFTAEEQLLIIVDTEPLDSGIYQCLLNNSLGNVTGKSVLKVNPGEVRDNSTSNMMGIIIITVVCCAVLTSIIWVVIIHQTRLRPEPQQQISELLEIPDTGLTQQQLQMHHFQDNISDHSSCKDSGTGDSAKRSSDNLAPEDFALVINNMAPGESNLPLLPYPTNHDRAPEEERTPPLQSVKDL